MTQETKIRSEKAQVRDRLRAILTALPEQQLCAQSAAACAFLQALPEFQSAAVVMMFLSISHEIETVVAVSSAFEQGKTVVVPCVVWATRRMIPVVLDSLDCAMTTDRYGLRTPVPSQPIATEGIDLIVVPGMGFDRNGHRLGRGGGFYDRFLADTNFRGLTCGFALEQQIIPHVPVNQHDVPVDIIVTDRHVRRFTCPDQ